MDKIDKRKAIVNLLLLVILIVLLVVGVVLFRRNVEKNENTTENVVELREIGYGSSVSPIGYTTSKGILDTFISCYNEHDGEGVASIMDLVSTYIYSECEQDGEDFDKKYVEYLSVDSDIGEEELIIMQYSLQQEESDMIEAINATDVELTLIDYTEIEDISEYLSKFTATIRTVSVEDGIDEEDTLEFLLVHKSEAYYVIYYGGIES